MLLEALQLESNPGIASIFQETRPSPSTRAKVITRYLQFLHPLVVISDGSLQRLQKLFLSLKLSAHGSGPHVSSLGVFRLANIRNGRTFGTGGLDPKHPVLRVAINLLLKLHFVHLQRKFGLKDESFSWNILNNKASL